MQRNLDKIDVQPKIGDEIFHANGQPLDFSLLQFWQWSSSDLVSNALRGVLAEFLVGKALGIVDGVRQEWDAFDLRTKSGQKIEVKSAAYVQSWAQTELSRISFGIAPTHGWDASTNEYSSERKRQADVYVFALFKHQDKRTVDPLNVAQWEFYVVPVDRLNQALPTQKTIGLTALRGLFPNPVGYDKLAEVVQRVNG